VAADRAGRAALDLRGGIAVLDPEGIVTWADEEWAAEDRDVALPRAPIGTNILQAYRGAQDSRAQTIASAIVSVIEGKATYFEIEHRMGGEIRRSLLTSVTALRDERAGAAVIQRVVSATTRAGSPRLPDVLPPTGAPSDDIVGGLTPREREVLEHMAAGLDNRAIAARLSIEYTTVRGHVRSIIEKIGARSRLEAVARAYRSGWVTR
jgi:DNA-binding NarL/FixJ family response regulator